MRYLLDTATFLWIISEDMGRFSKSVLKIIHEEKLLLSAVSTWEISVKYRVGKLDIADHPQRLLPDLISRMGLEVLPITYLHTLEVAELPLHHHDPFDRLLIGQAMMEDCAILSPDRIFKKYQVKVLW